MNHFHHTGSSVNMYTCSDAARSIALALLPCESGTDAALRAGAAIVAAAAASAAASASGLCPLSRCLCFLCP